MSVSAESNFFTHQVHSVVYRLNKYIDSPSRSVPLAHERSVTSWAQSFSRASNRVNCYAERILSPKRTQSLWIECARNSTYKLYKEHYKYEQAWDIRAYHILCWMNFGWKDDNRSVDRIWQTAVNREVTNLNCRADYKTRLPRAKLVQKWPDTFTKARVDLADTERRTGFSQRERL